MQYAEVDEHLIALDITSFGTPFVELFYQTDTSGFELFTAYSHNRFDNPLQKSDEQRYVDSQRADCERAGYGEILRDIIMSREMEEGETSPGEGFIPVIYIAAAKTPREFTFGNAWMPKNGLYVPIKDENSPGGYRFFKTMPVNGKMCGTLIPEKTVPFDKRVEAERAFAEFGLPLNQISYFNRPKEHFDERLVCRAFYPSDGSYGRFGIRADRHTGDSISTIGSRPTYKVVMKINTLPEYARL